ncbi:hypothetical protein Tco_0923523 [Tanacetum coccineum]|uniref:Uncharacterized protein n=1 Tax=Tanacetum coccineum TaxID=301880 RepID=A0ABQ5D7M9_9ASTR
MARHSKLWPQLLPSTTEGYEVAILIPDIGKQFRADSMGNQSCPENNSSSVTDKEARYAHYPLYSTRSPPQLSTELFHQAVSSDGAELKDIVRAFALRQGTKLCSSSSSCTCQACQGNSLGKTQLLNPREDLKGITTEAVLHIKDLQFHTSSSSEANTEVTKGPTCTPSYSQSTAHVNLRYVLNQSQLHVLEPIVAPCCRCCLWEKLSLPDLNPTCMTLELADRSISKPMGIAKDISVKVGVFHFPADFVVVDFEPDPRVLIGSEAIPYNLDKTFEILGQITHMTANKIDVIDMACEELLSRILWVELKELPPHLEYAFLEGDTKLPVIIAKELDVEEKSALVKVLKSHKRALAWILSDIQGINPEFCTHKILMEEDYAPAVQHQRRVNPKIHDVIKKEVEKLLEAGLIYPISDSPWCAIGLSRGCARAMKLLRFLSACPNGPTGDFIGANHLQSKKILDSGFLLVSTIFKDAHGLFKNCDSCQTLKEKLHNVIEMPQNYIQVCDILTLWGIDFYGPFPSSRWGNKYILCGVRYLSKSVDCPDCERTLSFVISSRVSLLQLHWESDILNLID